MRQALEQDWKKCYIDRLILASIDDVIPSLCIM